MLKVITIKAVHYIFLFYFQELERMWLSLLRHIQGEHVWQDEDGTDRMCFHEPLTDEDQRLKIWLDEDSPAFRDLEKIVTNKQLLRDIRQMTLHKHTSKLSGGSVSVYH